MRHFGRALILTAIGLCAGVGPAHAQVTQSDLLVAGRAISFIDSIRHGDVQVAIIYDPANTRSGQQADEIAGLMGNGLRIGNLNLKPAKIPIATIGNRSIDLFFLAEGVGAAAATVGRSSRQRKIPCITFDLTQVRNGSCTMGIRTNPRIEVIVNRAQAQADGTDLATVFRVMITEI